MAADIITVRLEIKSRQLRESIDHIVRSEEDIRVQRSGNSDHADLMILELGTDYDKDFEFIRSLLDVDAINDVFLISRTSDQNILLQAIRVGVKEFFSEPINEEDIRQALQKCKERRTKAITPEQVKLGQIINVMGSKGGVGTSTVAVNLAASLAEMKTAQSVALIDMNLLFGDIPLFLDTENTHHWGEIAKNIQRLDATFLMSIMSTHSSGVYVLHSPSQLDGSTVATPEIMQVLLTLMRTMFDYIIIDGGQGLDSMSLKILEMSDTLMLVSVLSLPCLANTNRLLGTFKLLGYPPEEGIKVVINRYLKNSDISLKDAEKSIHRKIFWTIANDYKGTMTAINHGKTLSQAARKASVTKNIKQLAEALAEKEKPQKKGWFF